MSVSVRGLIPALNEKAVSSSVFVSAAPGAADLDITYDPCVLPARIAEASVVHIHGWSDALPVAAANAARKASKPYVISPLGRLCHGPYSSRRGWQHRFLKFVYENKATRGASAILAVNKLEREALLEARVHNDAKVLSYGVSADEFSGGESPSDASESENCAGRTLLILGPIHPVEGLVPFLKAFAEIGKGNEGWQIVMAGADDGNWREMLAAAVRRKGATDRIRFEPCPSLESQHGQLQRASVLACPSLHYRTPVSIMQAMACGVPVIASDRVAADGMSTVVDVCHASRDEFRETLSVALGRTDEIRTAMATRARAWFCERYDWSVLVDRYVQLYRDLA